jgi:hypothetical protein
MPSGFFYSRELEKPSVDKRAIAARNEEAVAEFLANGNHIRTVKSRRRSRYVNPIPLSPITLARCQMNAARKAGAKRVANLFPSSVDPAIARALGRGRGYRRRRRDRMNSQISAI